MGLARVNIHLVLAVFALHGTAPLELALALRHALDWHGVVAPPTTHDLTAVRPARRLVTHSAGGAQGTYEERKDEEVIIWVFKFYSTRKSKARCISVRKERQTA